MSKSFSSDYYDAVNQHNAWSCIDDRAIHRRALKARLRFDFLFSGNIALARADVLDGVCFMHTTPQEIREWLTLEEADNSPITIMTLTGALEGDLLEWVRPYDRNKLKATPWYVVPNTLAPEFSKEFSQLPSKMVKNWEDIPKAFAKVIGNNNVPSGLLDYWSKWIEQTPKCFEIKKFPRKPDYESILPKTIDLNILPAYGLVLNSSETNYAIYLYENAVSEFFNSRCDRGELVKWFEKNLPSDSNIAVAVRDQINIWICRARAKANETDHETFSQADLSEPMLSRFILHWLTDNPSVLKQIEPIKIEIPPLLVEWLPDCDYGKLLRDVHIYRKNWLQTNDAKYLKKFAEKIADTVINDPGSLNIKASKSIVNVVRLVAIGGVLTAAYFSLTPGEGLYNVLNILGGAAAGAWIDAKNKLNTVVGKLYKKHIVHQVLQSVRPRSVVNEEKINLNPAG